MYQDIRLSDVADLLATRPAGRALILDTTTHPAYVAQRELSGDYLHPHGIDHVAAAQWRHLDGTLHLIGVQRFRGAAPFTVDQGRELDSLIHLWCIGNALPHPAGFEDAHTASRRNCDIAAQLHMPLVVVDAPHLSIVWCNRAALEENGNIWTGLRGTDCRDPCLGHCALTYRRFQTPCADCSSDPPKGETGFHLGLGRVACRIRCMPRQLSPVSHRLNQGPRT